MQEVRKLDTERVVILFTEFSICVCCALDISLHLELEDSYMRECDFYVNSIS